MRKLYVVTLVIVLKKLSHTNLCHPSPVGGSIAPNAHKVKKKKN